MQLNCESKQIPHRYLYPSRYDMFKEKKRKGKTQIVQSMKVVKEERPQ